MKCESESPVTLGLPVLPPASQLKGGLNSETKSFPTPVLSSSMAQKQTQTLRPASHVESMPALLKSTL